MLPLRVRIEKIFHGVETHRLSDKEKIPGEAACKEGHANSILDSSLLVSLKQCFLLPTQTKFTLFIIY